MTKILSELPSHLNCKDAINSIEGITRSSVNYMRHLILGAGSEKNQEEKANIFMIYYILNK